MVVEHNRRSTWTCPLCELRDAPLWRVLWWNDEARRQGAYIRHSAALLATAWGNSWERVVLVQGGCESGKKTWYYPVLRIHDILDRAGKTNSWERRSVYMHCMITWDGNEMMSIYSRDCWIYPPCHSVHLRYPCIAVHLPSLLKDVVGVCQQAS